LGYPCQIVAQIKLTETWKALNDSQYPLRVEQESETEDGIDTRSMTRGNLIEYGSSTNSKKSFTLKCSPWGNLKSAKLHLSKENHQGLF
jgi:hypothetical protein